MHMQSTAFIIKNDTTLLKSIFYEKFTIYFLQERKKSFFKNKKYMH